MRRIRCGGGFEGFTFLLYGNDGPQEVLDLRVFGEWIFVGGLDLLVGMVVLSLSTGF